MLVVSLFQGFFAFQGDYVYIEGVPLMRLLQFLVCDQSNVPVVKLKYSDSGATIFS